MEDGKCFPINGHVYGLAKSRCDHYDPLAGRRTDDGWMNDSRTEKAEKKKRKKKSQSIGRDVMAGVARCGGGVASSNDYRA